MAALPKVAALSKDDSTDCACQESKLLFKVVKNNNLRVQSVIFCRKFMRQKVKKRVRGLGCKFYVTAGSDGCEV